MSGHEPRYIFGIHDTDHVSPGEKPMIEKGKRGWIVFTEEVHNDPAEHKGHDYTRWSTQDFGIISRLNNGYDDAGTIPKPDRYRAFATRCGNFVAASPGCRVWIIGNEMNLPDERPGGSGEANKITPQMYAQCFLLCRREIKRRPGHEDDAVVIGAVAPWNSETKYPGNESGDWIVYFTDILELLGGELDGIALHTYTHGPAPALVFSDEKMASFPQYCYQFRAYRDFMHAIPADMRHLPVYVTETDQVIEWENVNRGWVRNAYREIAEWNNTPGNQQIRCLVLYRFHKRDKWALEDKGKVLDDWREAMENEYVWHLGPAYDAVFLDHSLPTVVTPGQQFGGTVRVRNGGSMTWHIGGSHPVRLGYNWLQEGARVNIRDVRTPLPHDVESSRQVELGNVRVVAPARGGTYTLQLDMVHELLTWFSAKGSTPLEIEIAVRADAGALKPPVEDITDQLAVHETAHYATRSLGQIRFLIIHHSAVPAHIRPERFAGYHVDHLGLPGIRYHFVIGAQGEIWQTNSLATVSAHVESVDASSVGICVGGNLSRASPLPAQMDSLSRLCAWLLVELGLSPVQQVIRGRKEFVTDETAPGYKWAKLDPGNEWDGGARWKDTLFRRVNGLIEGR